MAENTSTHPSITRPIDDRITAILSNILNTTILILFVTFIVGVFLSFSATLPKGFLPVHFAQGIVTVLLASAVIFRNKLQYKFRYYILLVTLFIPAIFGIYRYGLIGNGVAFLIIATVFTSAFSSRKQSILVLCFSALIIIVFMYLFCSGIITLDFDQNQYTKKYVSWMCILIIFVMFTGMLISVLTVFFNHLKSLIIESDFLTVFINRLLCEAIIFCCLVNFLVSVCPNGYDSKHARE